MELIWYGFLWKKISGEIRMKKINQKDNNTGNGKNMKIIFKYRWLRRSQYVFACKHSYPLALFPIE
jgi:hypothetical protein